MAVPLEDDMKECFDLFDRDGSGKIETTLLGKIVRSLGQTPSNVFQNFFVQKNFRWRKK